MSASQYTPATLSALLKTLSIAESNPDHSEILKHANNVLKTNKNHAQALHTKIVALLHLDRYEDALRALEANQIPEATFEKAYCLYKVGKLEDSTKVVEENRASSAPHVARGLEHVQAQAFYRLEKFQEASGIYKRLSEGGETRAVNEDFDLRVNSGATEAQLIWTGAGSSVEKRKITGEELSAFETTYNAACIHLARGELPQALILLKRAKDLCNTLDLSEEEKREELGPVLVQQLYVLLRLGKDSEATAVAEELDLKNLADSSVKLVGFNNNIICSSRSSPNPHLSLRKFAATVTHPSAAPTAKLFNFQTGQLKQNHIALDYAVGKYSAVADEAERLLKEHPNNSEESVLRAAAHSEGKGAKEALKEVEKALEANSTDIGLALMTTQLKMELGNITGAISTVEALLNNLNEDQRYQPGLVALMVALYKHQGRTTHVKDFLSTASAYWKKASEPNEPILRAAGMEVLSSNKPEDLTSAGELFTSILAKTPADKFASAGLVASYISIDPSKAAPYLNSLAPIDQLIAGINVDDLESAGVALPTKKRPAEDAHSKTAVTKPKKARVRKSRLPKDFDPSKKIDLERWLPIRDRSYYKPKGKKDKKKVAQATQGGKVDEALNVDAAKKVVPSSSGGGGAKGGGNKKKKKGGKW